MTQPTTQTPPPQTSEAGNPPAVPNAVGTPPVGTPATPAAVPVAPEAPAAPVVPEGGEKAPSKEGEPDGKADAEKLANDRKEANRKDAETTITEWTAAAKADPEIGGDKYDTAVVDMEAGIKAVGTDAFAGILEATGLKKHPEFLKVFAKIGRMTKDGTLRPGTLPQGKPKSAGEVLYDKTPRK